MNLEKDFEQLVLRYVEKILKGTDHYLDFWVADKIGGVACISSYIYIGFDEIRHCVDSGISVDRFSEYQDLVVRDYFKKPELERYGDYAKEKYLTSSVMNFRNWIVKEEKDEIS